MVVLHGYGGNNNPGRFGMNATADRHGFAVCYPQGAKDGRGKSAGTWATPFRPTWPSTTWSSSRNWYGIYRKSTG